MKKLQKILLIVTTLFFVTSYSQQVSTTPVKVPSLLIQNEPVNNTTDNNLLIRNSTTKIIESISKSQLFAQYNMDFPPSIQYLTPTLLDSYNGTRLNPISTTYNGFNIQKSINGNIGFSVINDDNIGNGAQSNLTVKGPGTLYTNNSGISHYGNGYLIPYLRNNGLLYSDKNLFISTWNNNFIDFRTGTDLSSATSKFKINANGQLNIGVLPTLDNTVTDLLGRKSDGSLVNLDKNSIINLIPTKTSQLTNNSGFLTSVPAQSFSSLTDKPTTLSGYGITDFNNNFDTRINNTVINSLSDVVITTPSTGQVLKYNGTNWINDIDNTETNTASNIGTSGVGIFKQKTGVNFEFKKITSGANSNMLISEDIPNNTITLDVDEANLSNINQSSIIGLTTDLGNKQSTLISGTNIKTVNGNTLLGSGDINISSGESETNVVLYSEFLSVATTANPPFIGTAVSDGTSDINMNLNLMLNHPGVTRLTSSTINYSGYSWQTGNLMKLAGKEVFTMIFAPNNFATTIMRAGFHTATLNRPPSFGVYFEYATNGNIVLKTANNGVRTTSPTITTLTLDTWYKIKITINSDATSVLGEVFNSTGTLISSQTITTNIPNGIFLRAGLIATAATTTSTAMLDLDYMGLKLSPIR